MAVETAVDYGSDVSCVTDLAADGRVVTGFTLVGEAIARRLITPRGRLIGDPNYGFDLTQYVNADMSPRDIAGLRAGVVAECMKDERVNRATVNAELDSVGILTLTILLDLGVESFTLVLSASDVSVTLVSVTP